MGGDGPEPEWVGGVGDVRPVASVASVASGCCSARTGRMLHLKLESLGVNMCAAAQASGEAAGIQLHIVGAGLTDLVQPVDWCLLGRQGWMCAGVYGTGDSARHTRPRTRTRTRTRSRTRTRTAAQVDAEVAVAHGVRRNPLACAEMRVCSMQRVTSDK